MDVALERDALRTRVRILESALACIGREAEIPLLHPETSFIAVHRIASVARQAAEAPVARVAPPAEAPAPPASTRRPISRAR